MVATRWQNRSFLPPPPSREYSFWQSPFDKSTFAEVQKSSREVLAHFGAKILRLDTLKRGRGIVSLYLCHPFPKVAQLRNKRYLHGLWFLPGRVTAGWQPVSEHQLPIVWDTAKQVCVFLSPPSIARSAVGLQGRLGLGELTGLRMY